MMSRKGITKVGCLFSLLVIAAVGYFGMPAVDAYLRYARYKDAMRQELRFRAELPDPELRMRFRVIADSLGLPPEAGEVSITRNRGLVTVESSYEEVVPLPGTERRLIFEPRAERSY